MKFKKTGRGFALGEFEDVRGNECSIQKSSSVEDRIWLGSNKIGLKEFTAGHGWEDRPEFDEDHSIQHHYIANNRMELNQEQVASLLPVLQRFVDTGEIYEEE